VVEIVSREGVDSKEQKFRSSALQRKGDRAQEKRVTLKEAGGDRRTVKSTEESGGNPDSQKPPKKGKTHRRRGKSRPTQKGKFKNRPEDAERLKRKLGNTSPGHPWSHSSRKEGLGEIAY